MRGRYTPCFVWKRHSQESTACCSMIRKHQQGKGIAHTHQETQEWCCQYFLRRIHAHRFESFWIIAFGTNSLRPSTGIKWHGQSSEVKRDVKKIRLYVVREMLFRLYESFVSHNTKLIKRMKSNLSDRQSKDESFSKVLTRYCENRKRTIYSETLDSNYLLK